ncbi:glycosyltransferase family 4 protein [Peribacillus sp. SCS-155]|uniref:glycosyltransferase family 4 protein n=1 Tax=Peribacillus sedimenti TaxID=3115297 RepID=UPI003906A70A
MKSVLMVVQNFYPEIGSAGNRLKNVYLNLKRSGYEVTVLTMTPSYPSRGIYEDQHFWDETEIDSQDILRIQPGKIKRYTHNLWYRLFHYLEAMLLFIITILRMERKFDYVFVSTPPIFPSVAGMIAKRRMKAQLITDVRDLWPESLVGVGAFTNRGILKASFTLEKMLYRSSDQIIVNSPRFRNYILAKGINPDRIRFIPNSLTEEELDIKNSLPPASAKRVKVIYTGNIGLAQDILKLIEVADCLSDHRHIEFMIIGYGIRINEVENMITEKGLTNIKLIDAKNRRVTLMEISSSHIAYVSLAEKDAFNKVLPGKIIDYMCVGRPIVGDVSGFAAEIITEAGCGLVAETRDVKQISQHILKLAGDRQLRNSLGDNGYRYAKEQFKWSKNIKGLLNILEA